MLFRRLTQLTTVATQQVRDTARERHLMALLLTQVLTLAALELFTVMITATQLRPRLD